MSAIEAYSDEDLASYSNRMKGRRCRIGRHESDQPGTVIEATRQGFVVSLDEGLAVLYPYDKVFFSGKW